MNTVMLDNINKPSDIKLLDRGQLIDLASEIRQFLISTVSKTGGHIGANLGVVELTIALHYFFDLNKEPLLFDVGHQGYTHKLLTGRRNEFSTLNKFEGMSRFISNKESKYDILDSSHAGTAISIATGMAYANRENGTMDAVIAFIGDGSLVEGMAFEGLNYAAENTLPLVIIINDNGMSIPPNLGAIHNLFTGNDWQDKSRSWFEGMGFAYESVADGHNIEQILSTLHKAKKHLLSKAVVVHVKTEKGRGLPLAKDHPYKLHFSMPFNPESGKGISATLTGETYQSVVGEVLTELMEKSEDVYAISPATPYASGIESLMKQFPERAIDVGMAEQHAVGMAVGSAMQGKQVFSCFQSTFMQRAMDQLSPTRLSGPSCRLKLFLRSGFAGFDGPTHHGIYDFGYLRTLPDLKIFYAGTKRDLKEILKSRAEHAVGPIVVLHPYETIPDNEDQYLPESTTSIELPEQISAGKDGAIITMGNRIQDALELKFQLSMNKNLDFSVINLRWLKPLPESALLELLKGVEKVITLEEGVKEGGMGCAVNQFVRDNKLDCDVFVSAIDKGFLPAGDKVVLSCIAGIDVPAVMKKVTDRWG